MASIMGIDPSSYTGIVQLSDADQQDEPIQQILIHHPESKGYDRLQLIAKSVRHIVMEWKPDTVFIESPALNAMFNTVLLIEIGTIIRWELFQAKIPWYNVPPKTLKLFTCGKGTAKKPEMASAVYNRWGFQSKYDDIVDAYALAQLGRQHSINGGNPTLKGVELWNSPNLKKRSSKPLKSNRPKKDSAASPAKAPL